MLLRMQCKQSRDATSVRLASGVDRSRIRDLLVTPGTVEVTTRRNDGGACSPVKCLWEAPGPAKVKSARRRSAVPIGIGLS